MLTRGTIDAASSASLGRRGSASSRTTVKSLELFYSIVIKKSLDFYFYEKRKFGFLLLQEEEGLWK